MSHIHASGRGVDTSPLRAGGSTKRKKKALPRTRGAPSPVNCREVVDLNVGGTYFTTTAQTLTANGECAFFCRILDDNALFAAPVDQHGRIFVDRDVSPSFPVVWLGIVRDQTFHFLTFSHSE